MGLRCLIGIHLHPSPTHPFVYVVEHSPESGADRQESASTSPDILTYPLHQTLEEPVVVFKHVAEATFNEAIGVSSIY